MTCFGSTLACRQFPNHSNHLHNVAALNPVLGNCNHRSWNSFHWHSLRRNKEIILGLQIETSHIDIECNGGKKYVYEHPYELEIDALGT